ESDYVRLDIDREGKLIFIEVSLPRRRWKINPLHNKPSAATMADIRWLDFRERIPEPILSTSTDRTTLNLQFSRNTPATCYYLAESVLLQADEDGLLTRIWIDDITDDLAGQAISAFRRESRSTFVHSC
ncbi:MAG: hypothetical protein U9R56_05030, partial [candidate division Zixibacteria bacterium]|nr:hypothetical protein [candidate division Zixibacteria bacterium]